MAKECEHCGELADEGDAVLVDVTRVDGRIVHEDYDFICAACLEEGERAKEAWEESRMEAKREEGRDAFEQKWGR